MITQWTEKCENLFIFLSFRLTVYVLYIYKYVFVCVYIYIQIGSIDRLIFWIRTNALQSWEITTYLYGEEFVKFKTNRFKDCTQINRIHRRRSRIRRETITLRYCFLNTDCWIAHVIMGFRECVYLNAFVPFDVHRYLYCYWGYAIKIIIMIQRH